MLFNDNITGDSHLTRTVSETIQIEHGVQSLLGSINLYSIIKQ